MTIIFEKHPYLSGIIIFIFLTGILLQILIGNVLGRMVNDADNMASTENKQLKQCKLKFVNCYKLNDGMGNVPVFVERFLEKIEIGKVKITLLHRISGQLILLSVLLSGLGAARGIAAGEKIGEILPFYVLPFLGLYLYYVAASFAGMEEKKKSLRFSLVDYLENHMAGRLKMTDRILNQKIEQEDAKKTTEEKKEAVSIFGEEEKQELENLLREFLTN